MPLRYRHLSHAVFWKSCCSACSQNWSLKLLGIVTGLRMIGCSWIGKSWEAVGGLRQNGFVNLNPISLVSSPTWHGIVVSELGTGVVGTGTDVLVPADIVGLMRLQSRSWVMAAWALIQCYGRYLRIYPSFVGVGLIAWNSHWLALYPGRGGNVIACKILYTRFMLRMLFMTPPPSL